MLEPKESPPPSLKLVSEPASDTEYEHFEAAHDVPFDFTSSAFSRVNAWWLADASLLTYWDQDAAVDAAVA